MYHFVLLSFFIIVTKYQRNQLRKDERWAENRIFTECYVSPTYYFIIKGEFKFAKEELNYDQ